ncbi:MAG: serine protease [Patescibacteria group bacterium]|nr:serine protease [Patescibacteria group bacterium]MCL5095295.1 serine protease [Patescibacteria group bacterium]
MKGSLEPITVTEKFSPLKIFGHRIQQIIMPIFAIAEGDIIPLGTGFIISQDGFMITAKHVIDEVFEKRFKRRDGSGRLYKNVEPYALYVTNAKNKDYPGNFIGGNWPIDRAWYKNELDIAYCWLRPAIVDGQPFKFHSSLSLSPGIPKIGEHVLGFGYYKEQSFFTGEIIKGRKVVSYSQETAFTQGFVKESFIPQRDNFHMNFPCFQTDARFEGGMSGGPIFNGSTGGVCGVICDSFGETDEHGEYTSYGSLIWPSLAINIETKMENDPSIDKLTVYEMIQRKFIRADDTFKNIEIVKNKNLISIIHKNSQGS